MKKRMMCALLALALAPAAVGAATIGIGAFGGASIPIVQDDNGQGTIFGLRVPVSLLPLVTIEPYFAKTSGGEKDQDVEGTTFTREGIDATSFGANAMLNFGAGLRFYPFVGIGSTKLERTGLDATSTTYNMGLGVGFTLPVAKLALDLRGELASVLDEDDSDSARKWANVTVGVSYGLFSFPPVP